MIAQACVYSLLDRNFVPIYIGVTSNLKGRVSGHGWRAWYPRVRYVGVDYYPSRRVAEASEALAICRRKPSANGQYYPFCFTLNRRVSGGSPSKARDMNEVEKMPPYYFCDAGIDSEYDRVFFRDTLSEKAGYNASLRRPNQPPKLSQHMARYSA